MHIHVKIQGLSKKIGHLIVNGTFQVKRQMKILFCLLTPRASIEKPQVPTM